MEAPICANVIMFHLPRSAISAHLCHGIAVLKFKERTFVRGGRVKRDSEQARNDRRRGRSASKYCVLRTSTSYVCPFGSLVKSNTRHPSTGPTLVASGQTMLIWYSLVSWLYLLFGVFWLASWLLEVQQQSVRNGGTRRTCAT
ncbi:hypothetical protein BC827DRAFT_1245241 [Russula dissimulans]|nr:hypothetical protein BC827DRAFT_1245241 [Russula dissimulans]